MKHIKLYEEFNEGETGDYPVPTNARKPAPGDQGHAYVAAVFSGKKPKKPKLLGSKPGTEEARPGTQEMDEMNIVDMLADLIKSAKKLPIDKKNPSLEDLRDQAPEIVVRNAGDHLNFYELIHAINPKDHIEDVKMHVYNQIKNKYTPAAHEAGEVILKREFIQSEIEGKYGDDEVLVLKLEISNDNSWK